MMPPGFRHSEETKHRMKQAARLRLINQDTHAVMSELAKRRWREYPITDETREKLAAGRRGKTLSPEVRAKMSAGRIGKPLSQEHMDAIRLAKRRTTAARRLLKLKASFVAIAEVLYSANGHALEQAHELAVHLLDNTQFDRVDAA